MSYILDALRKSDQLRRRSAAPTLPLGQVAVAAPKQPALIFYGLLALVLLSAGIAIGWLRPWQAAPETRPPAIGAVAPPLAASGLTPAQPPAIAAMPEPQPGAPISALAVQAVPVPAPAPVQGVVGAGIATPAPGASRSGALPKPDAGLPPKADAGLPPRAAVPLPGPAASSTAAAAPAAAVMTMAELPAAIQQELPPLSTSVHAYSGRPADRMVGINNRLLREGDDVTPGLRLEQITREGMILSYKGYTFRRGVH